MLGSRFDRLLRTLVARWAEWQAVPRDPDRVPELARTRFALEDARSAIAAEREYIAAAQVLDQGARTSVSDADRARLRVYATGYQQN